MNTLAIQQAIYERLSQDTTLQSLVSGVFDALPYKQPFPYIVIGEATETPWNTHTRIGRECTFTIHVFSRYAGMQEARTIAARVIELLEHYPLSASGVTSSSTSLDLCQFFVEADGLTRHGVVIIRCLVS